MKKILFCISLFVFGLSTVYGEPISEEEANIENEHLKELASKVKYKYEKVSDVYDADGNYIKNGYKVTAENLTEEIYVCAAKGTTISDFCLFYTEPDVPDAKRQDYVYLSNQDYDRFVVYGASSFNEYASEKIKVAKYNKYSEREECKDVDITKFKACDPYYEYEVTDNIFNYQLNEYKKNSGKDNTSSDKTSSKDNKDNKKDSSSMSFIDYIKKYGIYVGIIVVVFIAGAILYKKIKDKRGVL